MNTFDELMNRLPHRITYAMKKTPQNLKFHPEGSVFEHTRLVFEKLVQYDDFDLLVAAIFHDMGKINTTCVDEKGRITSYGHEHFAKDYIEEFKELFPEVSSWNKVKRICANHMKMHLIETMRPFKRAQLMNERHFMDMARFARADNEGRGKTDEPTKRIVRILQDEAGNDVFEGDFLLAVDDKAGTRKIGFVGKDNQILYADEVKQIFFEQLYNDFTLIC